MRQGIDPFAVAKLGSLPIGVYSVPDPGTGEVISSGAKRVGNRGKPVT